MLFPLHRTSSCRVPFPRRVRDGDPHGRRLRHGGSVALGGSAALVQYSPARRTYFVRDDCVAGTRPVPETLCYEDCGGAGCKPQYNGNVSRMAHSLAHGNSAYGQERDVSYAYDLMNRLTDVNDADINGFDETFAYDPQGRITAQRRGADAANAAGGEYDYYANTNKLKKVAAGMSAAVDAERLMNADSNFVYDADGNMIRDRSKNLSVTYDFRGLPTEFLREVASASGVAGAVDSVRLVMAYDGSGSRIGKPYERKDAGDTAWTLQLATHYTGIGSEIRVSGLDGTAKVVVNLPQGLGRDAVASASENTASSVPSFEWYLKNHLGSTMLVYGTGDGAGSLKAAYDYRAFGEQVNLNLPTDNVTENFTGKELDDETDLGYWGARYMDVALGLWISLDNARQHHSPYTYGNNNPIIRIDPDGNADVSGALNTAGHVVGATGAIAGGTAMCEATVAGCVIGVPMAFIGIADLFAAPFNLFTDLKDQKWPSKDLINKLPSGVQDAAEMMQKADNVKSLISKEFVPITADFTVDFLENMKASKPLLRNNVNGAAPADKTNVINPKY